jgi:hypothetical protein
MEGIALFCVGEQVRALVIQENQMELLGPV